MLILKDYLVGLLPSYIIDNDSFKDVDQKGFVERYMEIFGAELDDETYNKIEEVTDQIQPFTTESKFLTYLAHNLGNLPKFIDDEDQYRRFLSWMISVYKIKGRALSYDAMYTTLGQDATVIEVPLVGVTYDATPIVTYDAEGINYDENCEYCSNYDLQLNPFFIGLVEDTLDAATGWTLDGGSSIGSGQMTLVGVSEAEAVKQFALSPNTNYTIQIDIDSITGSAGLIPRLVNSNTLTTGSAYLTLTTIIVSGKLTIQFTTNGDANQYLQLDVDTDTETIVINNIRFWNTDETLNPVITGDLFLKIENVRPLIEPINAKFRNLIFDSDTVTVSLIQVFIDANGDLIFNNEEDPSLTLTLDNGDLIIGGDSAAQYFIQNGDLFFVTTT